MLTSLICLAGTLAAAPGPNQYGTEPRIPVLILTGENQTDWRYTSTQLREVLESSGKFSVEIALFPSGALADAYDLERFKAFIVDYDGARWGEPGEANFLKAIAGGTGLVALHGGARTFPDWKEYRELIGLTLDADEQVFDLVSMGVAALDEHPVAKGMGRGSHSDAFLSSAKLTSDKHAVIATATADGRSAPVAVAGSSGKGRVVATTLGYVAQWNQASSAAFDAPGFQEFVIRAVQWAATGKVTALQRLEPNTLSAADRAAGWRLLFDGSSVSGWKSIEKGLLPEDRWVVDGQALRVLPGGGDIISAETFQDFELAVEWRLNKGGKSAISFLPDGEGAPPVEYGIGEWETDNPLLLLRPPGQFNHARVVAQGGRVEHWLNGVRMLTLFMDPIEWARRAQGGRALQDPTLSKLPLGRIVLGDRGADVWFRNIKIRHISQPAAPAAAAASKVQLFNGSDLSGWAWFPQVQNNAPPAFVARDGMLVCEGTPYGYLATRKEYGDYRLELDWRYNPVTHHAGEAGLFARIVGDDEETWPVGVEVQIMYSDTGDLINFRKFQMTAERRRSNGMITRKMRDMERRVGEWNHFEVQIRAGDLTLRLNGEVVNAATNLGGPGRIGFKAEGTEVHFRNIMLTPLD